MPVKDLYYQKYLKYKNKYINLQSQMGGVDKYTGVDKIRPDLVARGSKAYPFPDKQFAKLFGNQSQDVQDLVIEKVDEIPISRVLSTVRRDSIDKKTFTSLKEKLRLDKSIEKEAMFILSPIIIYDHNLDNKEILMLAKIFIENSDKPNMTPLITYRTLSPEPLVNAPNLPLNFDLTKLQSAILDTRVNQELKLDFSGLNYLYQDNQLDFELFFIFICILITNKQIKIKLTLSLINLHIYIKSFNTIIFGLKQNIIIELTTSDCPIIYRVKELANALEKNTTLTKLNLYNTVNYLISYREAIILANALEKNTTLTRLDLGLNNIGDKGASAIASALKKNTTLALLFLSGNNIGDEGVKALATALEQNKTLEELYLEFNKIGNEGVEALANALKTNETLTKISLRNNKIGDYGATALASALKENTTLSNLDLYTNNIGDEGAIEIANALDINTTITKLSLGNNLLDYEGRTALAKRHHLFF